MEAAFFQKASPFLIFALSMIFSAVWNKVPIITLPAFVFSLYLYYPGSEFLQIPLAVLWVLLVMGHGRVTAYSMRETPKPLTCLLIAAGTAAAGVYSVINYNSVNIHTLRGFGDFIFAAASLGVITGIIAYFIIHYVLCPLVILDEERINTVVTDYYQLYSRGNRGNYIHFRDDTEIYCVNMLLFRKFRGRIDAPVTYMKYRCPFDVYFIREIQIDTRSVEKLAEWETDPYTKKQRKIFMFVLVFATVSVAFSLTVAGVAWLASN